MNSNISNRMNFIRSSYDDSESKEFSLISVSGLGLQAGDKFISSEIMTSDVKQLPSLNYSMSQSRHEQAQEAEPQMKIETLFDKIQKGLNEKPTSEQEQEEAASRN